MKGVLVFRIVMKGSTANSTLPVKASTSLVIWELMTGYMRFQHALQMSRFW